MQQLTLPGGATIRTMVMPSGNATVRVDKDGHNEPPRPAPRRSDIAFYVPYVNVHPATVAGAPADAVWVDVSSSSDAYFGALYGWWARGETFAIIEHDIVCRPDVVQGFEDCPEPWCVYGYNDICCPGCMEAWANELGCTRFRRELISAVPDAVSSIPTEGWDWHNLCDGLGSRLRAAGFTHHWHAPAVEHHHMGRNDQRSADD
jgi:hypothetical protein